MRIKLEIEADGAADLSREIKLLIERLGSMQTTNKAIPANTVTITNVSEELPAGRTVSAEVLKTMTIPELKEIAVDTHIDLTGKRTKAQILEALGVIEEEPVKEPEPTQLLNTDNIIVGGNGGSGPEPAKEPEAVITIEDARAKATKLLKADPTNREKVAAALKACGASKLTDITAPEDLKKFVGLLEAK